ncbi:MAG: hypothetical protein WBK19_15865 [Azonexus sp.]
MDDFETINDLAEALQAQNLLHHDSDDHPVLNGDVIETVVAISERQAYTEEHYSLFLDANVLNGDRDFYAARINQDDEPDFQERPPEAFRSFLSKSWDVLQREERSGRFRS